MLAKTIKNIEFWLKIFLFLAKTNKKGEFWTRIRLCEDYANTTCFFVTKQ